MAVPCIRLVVLTFNGGRHVERCFEHLHELDWPADRLELVLVDNASTDGSARRVLQRFPGVRVIRMPANRGFPANNVALADLGGVAYVGLVNDDAFVTAGYLRPLVEALEADPELGAACPRMLFDHQYVEVALEADAASPGRGDPRPLGVMITGLRVDGEDRFSRMQIPEGGNGREMARGHMYEWTTARATLRIPFTRGAPLTEEVELRLSAPNRKQARLVSGRSDKSITVGPEPRWFVVPVDGTPFDVVNNAGSEVLEDGYGRDRGFGERNGPAFDSPADVFAWCGGAVLLRPQYLDDVGLFDERFFLYYEDTDLSWRGQLRGWRFRYVPDAVIHHRHASTTVQGSSRFAYYTERNRLLMLLKDAPDEMVRGQLRRFVSETYDAARRDVVRALANGRRPNPLPLARRLRALTGFAAAAPTVALTRREVRARQLVADDEVVSGLTVG